MPICPNIVNEIYLRCARVLHILLFHKIFIVPPLSFCSIQTHSPSCLTQSNANWPIYLEFGCSRSSSTNVSECAYDRIANNNREFQCERNFRYKFILLLYSLCHFQLNFNKLHCSNCKIQCADKNAIFGSETIENSIEFQMVQWCRV